MSQQALSSRIGKSKNWTLALGIGAALLAAILLVVYINRYRSSVNAENAATPVLVAKNLIPKGTSGTIIAKQELFQVASLPKDDLKVGAIADPAYLNGRVAATDVFPGQQITTADLSVTTAETVPTTLTGQRAGVSRSRSTEPAASSATRPRATTSTSTSRSSAEAGTCSRSSRPTSRSCARRRPGQSSTYVLKANAALAQKLAFASDNGTLWFLLRPVVGAKKTPPLTITMQTLLSPGEPQQNRQVTGWRTLTSARSSPSKGSTPSTSSERCPTIRASSSSG